MEPIVENKGVGDAESVGFHRVQLTIVEVAHLQQVRFEREYEKTS